MGAMPYRNPEDKKLYDAARYIVNSKTYIAKSAAWRTANPGKRCTYDAAYRTAHREEILAREAAFHVANPERKRIYSVVYNANHPIERAARGAKRRALQRGAAVGDIAAVKAIYRRAREAKNVKCYLCGKPIPMGGRHVDHVVPLSKGGKHTASNLAVAHKKCNLSKGSKHPNEVGVLI